MSEIARLWRVRKDHHTLEADLRSHDDSYGVELQILCDGDLVFGRHYDRRELATGEAHALLQHYRADGWTIRTEPKARHGLAFSDRSA